MISIFILSLIIGLIIAFIPPSNQITVSLFIFLISLFVFLLLKIFLQKKISRKELRGKIMRDSFNYAKRQMAYWNRNREIKWFKPTQMKEVKKRIQSFMDASLS